MNVSELVRPFCKRDLISGHCTFPSRRELTEYNVIVCTLLTAATLYSQGTFDLVQDSSGRYVPPFGHVFIDECGHTTEPEFWAGIAGFASPFFSSTNEGLKGICRPVRNGGGSRDVALLPQLVISGDPKQLGPFIRFPLAESEGLGRSFLERVMETCQAYASNARGFLYPQNICKLKKNYRSNPQLLSLYSNAFYGGIMFKINTLKGELMAMADQQKQERVTSLNWLPSRDIPGITFLLMYSSHFPQYTRKG
jgi:helicase MOV-10